jgi:uncharacterized membrane protein YraQ (UPF0718 family)
MEWLQEAVLRAAAMLWQMLWALVLGFSISAMLQTFVSKSQMAHTLGDNGLRPISLAAMFGAASSSCSYAAAATSRTLFKKGAALVPALAFLLASTNLVIEMGLVIWMFLGWRFVVAEVIGALIMILILWLLVRVSISDELVEQARNHEEDHQHAHHHHDVGDMPGTTLLGRMSHTSNWRGVPGAFMMDVSMLYKEILIGVLIAGFLATLVPPQWWQTLFVTDRGGAVQLIENALVGPLIAVASFVCSVGNIPFASLLWSSGISFGGVVAFIYGDLIVLPLVLAYAKYYGWRMALAMTAILYLAMVGAALAVEVLFATLGLMPQGRPAVSAMMSHGFAWNYTTWLNLVAIAVLALFAWLHRRHRHQMTASG